MKNKITLLLTYYECPDMLRKQMDYWQQYPKEITDNIQVLVIDDGSKEFPAKDVLNERETNVDLCLLRIKEDIFQNTMGARNLGFHYTSESWIWNLDMDHIAPAESIKALLDLELNTTCYYLPARYRMQSLTEYGEMHRHSDTFIMTRKMFWGIGGYNEDFVKFYFNGAAGMFRVAMAKYSTPIELEDVRTLYFSLCIIEDASPIQKRNRRRGLRVDDKPKNHLRFEWEKIILEQDHKEMKRKELIDAILQNISYEEYTQKTLQKMSTRSLKNIEESLSLSA